jgi:hypothetical protein
VGRLQPEHVPHPASWYTPERNPANASHVGRLPVTHLPSLNISGFTLEKNPTAVSSVGKPSVTARLPFNTKEPTQGRSPTNATNVGRKAFRDRSALVRHQRIQTGERPYLQMQKMWQILQPELLPHEAPEDSYRRKAI